MKKLKLILILMLLATTLATAQKSEQILERNVRANMEFLAGDALQGRGSGSEFERVAATYFGSLMMQFGIEPGGQKTASGQATYIQTVDIVRTSFAGNPKLVYGSTVLEHGNQMVIMRIGGSGIGGALQKIDAGGKPQAGAVVFVRTNGTPLSNEVLGSLMSGGAAALIVEETPQWRANWARFGGRKPSFTSIGGRQESSAALIVVNQEEAAKIAALEDGMRFDISGELAPPQKQQTWNAVGRINGTDKSLASEVVLLSAHLDHLGVRQNAPGDDKIFNGADDDASGCVAVLELARVLAAGQKPKRTVYFAFYGSEEAGGFGSRYFVENLEFPKEKLVANLQFEMIGRPDEKVRPDELWLTGYDRSNLGPELSKQGAKLVADPHPDQNFFQRSDNYTLARQGIVAHTVSSYGLHKDYHQASDEVGTIDFAHMTRSINSMIKPIEWLVNSDFRPTWNEGKKP